jgi:hypothetical protein
MAPSEVYQGKRKRTNEIVALKKIIMHNEKDGVSSTNYFLIYMLISD